MTRPRKTIDKDSASLKALGGTTQDHATNMQSTCDYMSRNSGEVFSPCLLYR